MDKNMEQVKKVRDWLNKVPDNYHVGIDDGGLTLAVVEDTEVSYEVGGVPKLVRGVVVVVDKAEFTELIPVKIAYYPDEVYGSLLVPVQVLVKSGKMWPDEKVVGLIREDEEMWDRFLSEDESTYDWKYAPVFDLVHDKVIVP